MSWLMPWLFIFAPAALALLALAYRARQQGKRLRLGSTFFLEKIQRVTSKRRMKLPLRYYLEALALLLLFLAASGLQIHRSGETMVVVLDTSLSMAAVERDSGTNGIQNALRQLPDLLSDATATRFLPVRWNDRVSVLSDVPVTKSEMMRIFETLKPSYARSEVVALRALESLSASHILVLTDSPLELRSPSLTHENLQVHAVTPSRFELDNLALSISEVDQQSAAVTLHAYSDESVSGELEFVEPDFSASDGGDWTTLERRVVEVDAHSNRVELFQHTLPFAVRFRPRGFDANPLDNFAFYASRQSHEGYAFVSPLDIARRTVQQLGRESIAVMTPEEFEAAGGSGSFTGVVAHRYVPSTLSAQRLVLLSPEAFPVELGRFSATVMRNVTVSSFAREFPINRYVPYTGLVLPAAQVFGGVLPHEAFIASERGPVGFRTLVNESEVAVLGAELFARDQRAQATVRTIVLLNIFGWITEPPAAGTRRNEGSRSGGDFYTLPELRGEERAPGFYFDGSEALARNFFAPEESNLRLSSNRSLALGSIHETDGDHVTEINLLRILAFVFLAFVVFELLLLAWSRRRGGIAK